MTLTWCFWDHIMSLTDFGDTLVVTGATHGAGVGVDPLRPARHFQQALLVPWPVGRQR